MNKTDYTDLLVVPSKEQVDNTSQTEEQNYYGRCHYETVPFSQANFQNLQEILDKRNELLSTVKLNNPTQYL